MPGSRMDREGVSFAWLCMGLHYCACRGESRGWYDIGVATLLGVILTSLAERSFETAAILQTCRITRGGIAIRSLANTAAGGATGTRYFGNATWTDEDGNTWIQKSSYRDPAKDIYRPFLLGIP